MKEKYKPAHDEILQAEQSMSAGEKELTKDRELLLGDRPLDTSKWNRWGLNIVPTPDKERAYRNLKVAVPQEKYGQFEAHGAVDGLDVLLRWKEIFSRGSVSAHEIEVEIDGEIVADTTKKHDWWKKYGDAARLLAYEALEGKKKLEKVIGRYEGEGRNKLDKATELKQTLKTYSRRRKE